MRAIHRPNGGHALSRAASVAACSLLTAAVMLTASSVALADTMGGTEVQSVGISGGHLISVNIEGKVLTVVGTGRAVLPPDTADVVLGVSVRGEGAGEVAQRASAAMAAVVTALTEAGIAESDLQTTQLGLSAVYDYETEPPPIVGWEASNMIRVTVSDIEAVGDIVDTAMQAGANRIDGITFRVEDETAAKAAARASAVADANLKADELAAAAGLDLTGIVSLSELADTGTEVMLEGMGDTGGGQGFATPVLPGTVAVVVSVTVAYAIG
jgi:uncharacterized protein YggE